MLNGDEHAWNEQLAKRINQYRKRPSDYQPVVEFCIHFTHKNGSKIKFAVSKQTPTLEEIRRELF